jgi:hypothetical protein
MEQENPIVVVHDHFLSKEVITKEDSSSSNEDEDNNNDTERIIFMAVEESDKEGSKVECEEAEADYIEELISSIESLRIEKMKNKSLQAELKKKEGSQNSNSK